MNKDDFNNLSIKDQIDYMNNQLLTGITLTNLCKNIEIARSTVSGRIIRQGYIFDKDLNQYIIHNKEINGRAYSKLTVSDQLTNEINEEKISPKSNNASDKDTVVSNELTHSNSESNALSLNPTDSDNLGYLLKNIDILKNVIENNKGNNNPNEINNIDDIVNNIYKFKQEKREYKVKSLRIDIEIQKEFEEIAKDLSPKGINQQEFLNYILDSYITFYKNLNKI